MCGFVAELLLEFSWLYCNALASDGQVHFMFHFIMTCPINSGRIPVVMVVN